MNYVFTETAPSDISGNSSYDPSTRWGEEWAMPTTAQWNELLEKCTIEAVESIPRPDYLYPVAGVKITGPNGNHIYMPANVGHWSATAASTSGYSYEGEYVGFRINGNRVTVEHSSAGHSKTYLVRPVGGN